MLLKLYNLSHAPIGVLKNCKDLKVESVLSTGDKMLSFLWHQRNKPQIPHEYYIRTDTDEYVVKENSKASGGYRNIVAKLNLEDLEGRIFKEFSVKNHTALEAANMALIDTGWTCISTVPTSRVRSIGMVKASAYNVLTKILDAYTCEVRWDTLTKTVYLKERTGEDKGTYFISRLNLKEISDNADTYDYITRIIPTGAEGLDITSVNGGKEYLENYQYSAKKKTLYWEDSNYTDAQWLKEDAQYKLNELSKPKKTMQAKVIDLANAKPGYADLSYAVGDTVTLIDNETGIREKQRITKTINYLNAPEKNTCDISNTVLSFEELQKKLFAAAECIDNITTNNGTVKGSAVDKIDISQIKGFEHYIAESVDDFRANYIYARTEFGTPYAVIGSAILTSTSTTTLSVSSRAEIKTACVEELNAKVQQGDYAKFKVVESENISALEARIDKITSTEITTEYLNVNYAKINMANVDTATIRQGFLEELMVKQGIIADRVSAGTVIATDVLTGVNIYADDITAGTLSVDRLILRGTNKSLVYALNNSGNLVSTQVNTLDANILTDRTITASKIVAKSLTVTEIDVSNLRVNGFINANKMTAANIDVGNLFAQNITAAGSIQSSNYVYSSGNFSTNGIRLNMSTGQIISKKFAIDALGNAYFSGALQAISGTIGGFQIGSRYIANGATTLGGALNSVYVGLDGISCGTSFKVSSTGALTATNVTIVGSFKTTAQAYDGVAYYCNMNGYGISLKTDFAGYQDTELEPGGMTVSHRGSDSLSAITKYRFDGIDFLSGTGAQKGFIGCNSTSLILHSRGSDGISLSTSKVSIGNYTSNYGLTVPSMLCYSWIRTVGATGWFSETYGGGWYMTDTTYVRIYNNKKLLLSGGLKISAGQCNCDSHLRFANNKGIYGAATIGTDIRLIEINTANNVHVGTAGYNTYINGPGGSIANLSDRLRTEKDNSKYCGDSAHRWKGIYAVNGAVNTSDRNFKKNIRDISDIFEDLFLKLRPRIFQFLDGDRDHIGAISQEVEDTMKELGITDTEFAGFCRDLKMKDIINPDTGDNIGQEPVLDTEGNPEYIYSLRYQEFIFLLVEVVQRLYGRVAELENQIKLLKVS